MTDTQPETHTKQKPSYSRGDLNERRQPVLFVVGRNVGDRGRESKRAIELFNGREESKRAIELNNGRVAQMPIKPQ